MAQSDLAARIRADAGGDALAVGLYLVPGFPDWATSRSAVRRAVEMGVTFIEFPVVREPAWSSRTGPTIARALGHALPHIADWSPELDGWLADAVCPVGIVYPHVWPRPDEWKAPGPVLDRCQGLLFETDPEEWPPYALAARRLDVALVCAFDGREPALSASDRAGLEAATGFAYVSLGAVTGDLSAPGDALSAKVTAIRAHRPDLPICCAFGIRDRQDVARLGAMADFDGIVVGTAALEALADGLSTFETWLDGMLSVARPLGAPR
jgi:tryptophan synthase alpha subunit